MTLRPESEIVDEKAREMAAVFIERQAQGKLSGKP